MKKSFTRFVLTGVAGILLSACSAEKYSEIDSASLNATTTTASSQEIVSSDLVGTWNMFSMTSMETMVDFNLDGTYTNDLLEETDCFDPMYFIFMNNGIVDTRQSRLFFDSVKGDFTCYTTGDYTATYSVSGDILTVTFTIDGVEYTETKTISIFSENGNDFLKVTLTKEETNAAVYVADDPGNTVASEIQKIEMVYIKA
ncbi:lipocalin family protein [Salinimicrobium sp. HB62]|uniref:lipocalin family protein n=1 Tax=Salinimicrobium sp. HB62 TaxID=3077781 RepID=UPI002D767B9F|nr:lipocalin family protein [Salinimicrobium sp. HB62]